MRSALASAALVGVLALAAGGQPPQPSPPKVPPPKLPAMEDDIAKALRTHPDVLAAEAEAQLAQAKLLQSKLAVAGKVTAAKRVKDRAKLDVSLAETRVQAAQKVADTAQKQFELTKNLHQSARISTAELQLQETAYEKAKLAVVEAEQAVQGAKLALAAAEADYDTLVGQLALVGGQAVTPPKVPPTLQDDIAKALRTHPDMLVTEAEALVVNAKLQQARRGVALKIAAAKRERDRTTTEFELATQAAQAAQKVVDKFQDQMEKLKYAGATLSQLEQAQLPATLERYRLAVVESKRASEAAKAKRAEADAEYEALVGASPAVRATGNVLIQENGQWKAERVEILLDGNHNSPLVLGDVKPGSVADKLRTALAKPIAHECKGDTLDDIVAALKAKAGLDVLVRTRADVYKFTLPKQELSLAAWLELLRDEYATRLTGDEAKRIEWYVREYGLSFSTNGRPEGALTVGEFVKAMNAEKRPDAPTKKP